jgi:hypothetical protein
LFLLPLSSFVLFEGVALPEQTRGDMTARLAIHVEGAGALPGAAVVRVTLSGRGRRSLQVEPPRLSDPLNAWQVQTNEWAALERDRAKWTTVLLLRQTKPGSVALPDLKVRFRDGPDAAWQEAEWVDLLKTAREAPPPEFLPRPAPAPWLPWTAAAAAVLAVAVVVWRISRKRRTVRTPPPEQWALRELDRLEGTAKADAAAYHTALSDVVRRYLADRFGLPAPRRTTAEFLETVQKSGALSVESQTLLRDFLERCDLAKFAPVGASAEEGRQAARIARTLIEQTSGTKTAVRSS